MRAIIQRAYLEYSKEIVGIPRLTEKFLKSQIGIKTVRFNKTDLTEKTIPLNSKIAVPIHIVNEEFAIFNSFVDCSIGIGNKMAEEAKKRVAEFWQAAKEGDLDKVKKFLEEGIVNVNATRRCKSFIL